MAEQHALRRTSPKGPGQPFVGTCVKCGIQGITLDEMGRSECVNPAGLNGAETFSAVLSAIEEPKP